MVDNTGVVFEKILNFRDIATASPQHIRAGRVYRSARPDLASESDQQRLRDEFHIRTILDLRTTTEHDGAAEYLRAHHLRAGNFEGCDIVKLNFNGSAYSTALLSRLSYFNQARLIFWHVLGWRKDAIAILARNVVAPGGLSGLAADSLEYCQAEIKSVFDLLDHETIYPIMIHCTQGKDRTGLVILLIQLLMGVDSADMTHDYLQSQQGLQTERHARVQEIMAIGMPESFADCQSDWVDIVCKLIKDRYGGIEAYLQACGVSSSQQDRFRQLLGTPQR